MTTRISTSQFYDNSRAHVAEAEQKQAVTADKASAFKEMTHPSQHPADWVRASNLKDDITIRDSVQKNAALASHVLSATENALANLQETVQRAHELAISSSNADATTGVTAKSILGEAKTLYETAIQAANSRYADRSLFAGLKTQAPAFDKEGNYVGDRGEFNLEIDRGMLVKINTDGEKALLGKDMYEGVNILDALGRFVRGLELGDLDMIHGTLTDLRKSNEQISLMRADVGGRQAQIEKAISNGEVTKTQVIDTISKLEDADAIKVFSDLARDQTVLKASVASTQKILSEVPADILFK